MTHNNTAILDFDDGSADSAKQFYNLLIFHIQNMEEIEIVWFLLPSLYILNIYLIFISFFLSWILLILIIYIRILSVY